MPRTPKYTPEVLAPVVRDAVSIWAVLDALAFRRTGGNYRHIGQRIAAYGLDTPHFKGQGWARGETRETHPAVRSNWIRLRTPDDDVFRPNSPFQPSRLSVRLVQIGRPYVCVTCGLREWNGARITLHVDHINGETSDNRLENLRFLCPNCHQQTHTWGRSARGRVV